jgi:acetyl-CoA acyltransferase
MAKLKPAFIKPRDPYGGQQLVLTDGGAATLLMSEEKALELNFTPVRRSKAWSSAVDPFEDLLFTLRFVHDVLKSKL